MEIIWAKKEEIKKFETLNRFSKFADVGYSNLVKSN